MNSEKENLKNGDIIDIHQTVNGQRYFVILNVEPFDIRYANDLNRKYEYDIDSLLGISELTGEVCWSIIGNIYEYLNTIK